MSEKRIRLYMRCDYRGDIQTWINCKTDSQGQLYTTDRQYIAACKRLRDKSGTLGIMSTNFRMKTTFGEMVLVDEPRILEAEETRAVIRS